MKKYLLFDLDGTLTDPKEGITTCVQYALQEFGIEEEDKDKLEPFIGPPLKDSFKEFYGLDEVQAEAAVAKYRERFENTGIFENRLYDDIPGMLRTLKARGKRLAVASSKPQVFVERILEHFEIKQYFHVIVGSELDGSRTKKEEVIEEALKQLFGEAPVQPENVVMIGDRKFDVEGAKEHSLISIGVTYGYGGMEELKAAKADYIVRSVKELEDLLLRGTQDAKYEPPFNKIWQVLFPILIYFFVCQIGVSVGMYLIMLIQQMLPDNFAFRLMEFDEAGLVTGITGNGSAVVSIISFIIAILVLFRMGKKDIVKADEEAKKVHAPLAKPVSYLLMAAATAGAAVGINLVYELLGFTNKSEIYQQTAQMQYSSSLFFGLLLYGIVAPIAEEMLFRGMVYNRLKKYMKITTSILLSALCFGVYHQNIISGSYAFLMGCLIAYFYEKFGFFYVAVIAHVISNVVAYLLTATGLFAGGMLNWAVCIASLLIGAGSLVVLHRRKVE